MAKTILTDRQKYVFMRILFLGDIVGKPGREAVKKLLPGLKKKYFPDFILTNGENLSHGKGMNASHLKELTSAGIDFFTSGNHIWAQKDIFPILNDSDSPIIRPANYPDSNPGFGWKIVRVKKTKILIINLMGRVFMRQHFDCPFRTFDKILKKTKKEKPNLVLVDFHAEATSEKICFALYVKGRAHAVIGTHTHVQTADEMILDRKTAYITDVGFVGLKNSAIGIDVEPMIQNFLSQMPVKHTLAAHGTVTLNGVVIDFKKGRATHIERVLQEVEV